MDLVFLFLSRWHISSALGTGNHKCIPNDALVSQLVTVSGLNKNERAGRVVLLIIKELNWHVGHQAWNPKYKEACLTSHSLEMLVLWNVYSAPPSPHPSTSTLSTQPTSVFPRPPKTNNLNYIEEYTLPVWVSGTKVSWVFHQWWWRILYLRHLAVLKMDFNTWNKTSLAHGIVCVYCLLWSSQAVSRLWKAYVCTS